jgi:hypothetical protein
MITKAGALAELSLIRAELDKISEDVLRKLEGAEEALKMGGNSAAARNFLAITQIISSQHELYNALFKTIAASETFAIHLEQLWKEQ